MTAAPGVAADRPAGWIRRRWTGMTLRGRLLVALIALLALICLLVGLVTTVVLRQYLLAQVDGHLTQASQQFAHPPHDPYGPPGDPGLQDPGDQDCRSQVTGGPGPGDAPGTLHAFISGGAVTCATYVADRSGRTTTAAQNEVLLTVDPGAGPVTRDLPGLGDYRLVAVPGGGDTVVTGLPLGDVNDTLLRLDVTIVLVAIAGLIAVGLVGETIIRRTLRPLNRVAATATRVSEMTLDRGEVALSVRVPDKDTDPRTEVGQVGASLNRMLGHVATALGARQESETRVRQFVADASHELRTPLAAIRGYAELTRRMDEDLPPDVTHAMRRVESESARMTTLVEDLLLLARLDSGRPIDRAPVDLTRLLVDAVSDAHVAGPDHTWRLDLPDDPVTVPGDAARLHQVFANLLANAPAHTPPGTTVTVTLSTAPGPAREGGDEAPAVHVKIADDGPGIPADLQPAVFERFARGDSSRSRAAGSTGLGLAIVTAVVEAHGGTVELDSAPGRTVFTVALPAA